MIFRAGRACSTAACALLVAPAAFAQTIVTDTGAPTPPAARQTPPPVSEQASETPTTDTAAGANAAAPAAAPADPADSQDIVVTGLRASLQRAQSLKRNNSSVVEAVSAEDIGKLPQSSVAASPVSPASGAPAASAASRCAAFARISSALRSTAAN